MGALAVGAVAASIPWVARASESKRKLAGVFPIGFTPVDARDQVDFDGLAAQVNFCRRGGVHGIAWPQIASGWTVLSEAERMHGAEVMVSAAKGGRRRLFLGVQSKTADFKETERYAQGTAEEPGADAIICIAPPGVSAGPEIVSYYQRLGRVTSLPLVAQTGGDFSVDLLIEMFDSIPTFRHVKDEAGDPLERVSEIRRRTGGKLNCFSGKGVQTMITEMKGPRLYGALPICEFRRLVCLGL